MKIQDSLILLLSGFIVWTLGTVYYAYRGAAVLESGNVRYWTSFTLSPMVSTVICIALLRWRHVPASQWVSGMLLIAIPGMIGEALVLCRFSTFMPRVREASAGRYGAFLFVTYAVVLGIAEAVTLRATP
jgi:hypothetical protein